MVVVPPSANGTGPGPATYKMAHGSFGVKFWSHVSWMGCREVFHRRVNTAFWVRGFFFTVHKSNREAVAAFFDAIETQLGLWQRTKFYQTNLPDVVYVKPARFWHRQWMRFSLLTILLRTGMTYVPGEPIMQAMRRYTYSHNTYRAIERFLSGRTYWTGVGWSWVNTFTQIPCCSRKKCQHADRRCRRWLDDMLVPSWRGWGLNYPVRAVQEVGRFFKRAYRFAWG